VKVWQAVLLALAIMQFVRPVWLKRVVLFAFVFLSFTL
jgi:hypothetical protein